MFNNKIPTKLFYWISIILLPQSVQNFIPNNFLRGSVRYRNPTTHLRDSCFSKENVMWKIWLRDWVYETRIYSYIFPTDHLALERSK